jgi:hypothetical protein
VFPMVSWIWWSIPFFVIGALVAGWPGARRVRAPAPERAAMPSPATTPGAAT